MGFSDWARARPLTWFFGLAYLASAVALWVIGLPRLHGAAPPSGVSLAMFPVMVIAVGLSGIVLTRLVDGRDGLRQLAQRWSRPVRPRWLLVLLVPPIGILIVLGGLSLTVSSVFSPNFFVFGLAAGVLAGFCEEIGWTGFAYPRLSARLGWLPAALILGSLWGLWHLPVVDSLGAASPHGQYWPEFFVAFVALLTAVRVVIAWVYTVTGSLRMAQALHASSTGFLVILSAPHVSPAQEALWYAVYAGLFWLVALVVVVHQRATALGVAAPAVVRVPETVR